MIVKLICKFAQWILKKQGRGTAFPGILALKLDKKFLGKFKKPELLIFVTGTVGKTTTAAMIADVLRTAGYKVGTNGKGSNLLAGVCSLFIECCSISGKPQVDAMVVEVDERYVKTVLPYMTPDYFLINNIARDQLARNGHFDIVFHDICDHINEKPHLILNADNPLSYRFSLGRENEITYFGVERNQLSSSQTNEKVDVNYCPVCSTKLVYDYFNFGNFGAYHCPECDFKRQTPAYETRLTEDGITIDGDAVKMPDDTIYNAYNMAAAYTVARAAGVDKKDIIEGLHNINFGAKRFQQFSIGDVEGTILVSKNETPASYTQSLEHIERCEGKKTLAVGFTRISGRYDEKDISWLYDIKFELLKDDDSIDEILLVGPFAYDLAVRMKIAGIDVNKLKIVYDYETTYEELKKCRSHVFCVFYFDMSKHLVKVLKEKGDKLW